MTNMSASAREPEYLGPDYDDLARRAFTAQISTNPVWLDEENQTTFPDLLCIEFPNGRGVRKFYADAGDAPVLLANNFEEITFLGSYEALVRKGDGSIEARISGASTPRTLIPVRALSKVPGFQVLDTEGNEDERAPQGQSSPNRNNLPENWRIAVNNEAIQIEISPASDLARSLFGGSATIKISGVATSSHDTAQKALERYANALLFDLDVVYNVPVQLARRRKITRRRRQTVPKQEPKFPRNNYASHAIELYQYGRSAHGLPLLEFLAYYQSVEYFFPFFAREETINILKSVLLNPRFDPSDDGDLSKLINASSTRTAISERQQLRATIRACIPAADLRDFLDSDSDRKELFVAKKQAVGGVDPLRLSGDHPDIRDQVADRLYSIRCRIVHAKQDGGPAGESILLPASREAQALAPDIDLMRFVSQGALIARAARS